MFPDLLGHFITDLTARPTTVGRTDARVEKPALQMRIPMKDILFIEYVEKQLELCKAGTVIVWGSRPAEFIRKLYGLGNERVARVGKRTFFFLAHREAIWLCASICKYLALARFWCFGLRYLRCLSKQLCAHRTINFEEQILTTYRESYSHNRECFASTLLFGPDTTLTPMSLSEL